MLIGSWHDLKKWKDVIGSRQERGEKNLVGVLRVDGAAVTRVTKSCQVSAYCHSFKATSSTHTVSCHLNPRNLCLLTGCSPCACNTRFHCSESKRAFRASEKWKKKVFYDFHFAEKVSRRFCVLEKLPKKAARQEVKNFPGGSKSCFQTSALVAALNTLDKKIFFFLEHFAYFLLDGKRQGALPRGWKKGRFKIYFEQMKAVLSEAAAAASHPVAVRLVRPQTGPFCLRVK